MSLGVLWVVHRCHQMSLCPLGPAFTILMLLASLTSCTNPWISAAFSTSLARAMARVLCPCRHPRGHTG